MNELKRVLLLMLFCLGLSVGLTAATPQHGRCNWAHCAYVQCNGGTWGFIGLFTKNWNSDATTGTCSYTCADGPCFLGVSRVTIAAPHGEGVVVVDKLVGNEANTITDFVQSLPINESLGQIRSATASKFPGRQVRVMTGVEFNTWSAENAAQAPPCKASNGK